MTDVQKLRALLDAADMQLPLEVVPDLRPNLRSASNTGGFLGCGHIATMSRYDRSEDDAALIAGAVNALPELLDEVERLRTIEAQAAAWRSHTEALVAAMKTWGTWEDGVPSAEDCGEVGKVGAAFDAALAALKGGE